MHRHKQERNLCANHYLECICYCSCLELRFSPPSFYFWIDCSNVSRHGRERAHKKACKNSAYRSTIEILAKYLGFGCGRFGFGCGQFGFGCGQSYHQVILIQFPHNNIATESHNLINRIIALAKMFGLSNHSSSKYSV